MWGRKADAFSKASLDVLGCVQGTCTSWGSAINTFEQKWPMICLWTFPGCAPQFPVCAIATRSLCWAPSCGTQCPPSPKKQQFVCQHWFCHTPFCLFQSFAGPCLLASSRLHFQLPAPEPLCHSFLFQRSLLSLLDLVFTGRSLKTVPGITIRFRSGS